MDKDKAKENPESRSELNRREFFGALGGVAAAGLLASESASGQNSLPLFQDSFGNIAPAAGDALNVGVYPPPVYTAGSGPTTVTPGYVQPNILMIMVDQLRSPRWLPSGGQAQVDQLLPNIAFLRNHSFNFPNYFVAATDCTPCRATLLTGLYSQQTYMLKTQISPGEPNMQTGFPTFGTALAQQANYATCWIGKWHLSDFVPQGASPGANGPGDYGFTAGSLNLPKDNTLASPCGYANEGTDGYNSAPYGSGTPNPPVTVSGISITPPQLVNDAAIANWFINKWLPNAPTSQPWYTAVSFINPHDITDFPFGLGVSSPNIGKATAPGPYGFQPPPTSGYPLNPAQPDQFVPPLVSLYSNGAPAQWNTGDDPMAQPYGVKNSNGWGKPGLQAYFENSFNYVYGPIYNSAGFLTFLNYYFWLQSCVDYHIGRVMNSLNSSPFGESTIVIFTSDHGDYGGSHNLHAKGGALYDESLNVPLYVSFPNMRPPFSPAVTARVRPFVCSSVDIFPFLYTLALGNSGWRNNPADPYAYLSGREAILDAILSATPQQRRLSSFPNSNGIGFQPYILHTQDEFPVANLPSNSSVPQPSHAIAYRTVDTTVTMTAGGSVFYGGAKLGIYSYWTCLATTPDNTKAQQFEFYNYSAGNVGEIGNSALVSPTQLDVLPAAYLSAYNAVAPNELYVQYSQFQSVSQAAKNLYISYISTKIASCSQ